MSDLVTVVREGEVAHVTLHSPHGNALGWEMFTALRKTALGLSDSPPAFVLLTARGEDYCTGLTPDRSDRIYKAFEGVQQSRDAFRAQEIVQSLRTSIDAWGRLPCMLVTAIQGRCQGPGLLLALMCDVQIAETTATFGVPGAAQGLFTGLGELGHLASVIGERRAVDALLSEKRWSAEEAVADHLVSRVAAPGMAELQAGELIHKLATLPKQVRLQTTLAARALRVKRSEGTAHIEAQAAARVWIDGTWQGE